MTDLIMPLVVDILVMVQKTYLVEVVGVGE
jgi:hypothetical protein